MQRDVQQQRADHPALGSSLLGASEQPLLDHARRQPVPDLFPGREPAELGDQMVVVDAVERRFEVRVQHPPAHRIRSLDRVEGGLDRVLAAASGPKPIRSRLEPGFPFRFQRGRDPSLQHAVDDHGDTERPAPAVRFRDIHPSDRTGLPRLLPALQLHRQLGLVLGGHDNAAVHARGQTSSVELRNAPNRQQRVRPRPEHQLLQVPDPWQVPHLRGREDPLPQAPYILLAGTPRHSVPVEDLVLRSVHHPDWSGA
jgi:hypothetical protein